MSSDAHFGARGESAPLNDTPAERYELFRHPRRIRLLEILERGDRRPLSELTTELLEREGCDVADGKRRHQVRIDLAHNHLPRFAAHGLVDWDVDTGVKLVADPPACPDVLSSLLDADADVERLLAEVVDPVRLRLLELVGDASQPPTVDRLASVLAARESAAPSDAARAKIELHHSHLPALEGLDLLAYDRESGLVEPSGDARSLA